jgi:hypothetical protein
MADFSSHAQKSAQHSAVDYDAASYARAKCDQNQILDIFASADPHFTERRGIRVILKHDGGPQYALNRIPDGKTLKARQIGGTHNNALLYIDEAGHANADALQVGYAYAGSNGGDDGYYVRNDVFGTGFINGRNADLVEDLTLIAYGGYPEICASEIHSDGVRGHAEEIITD